MVLALLDSLQVLLLRCPLQCRINQKLQITEVLGGKELWGGGWRSVEEAACCCCGGGGGCASETGTLFLGLPQETLRVQLQQCLNGALVAGVAGAGQDSRGGAAKKTEVRRGRRPDDRWPLVGHIWRAGPPAVGRVSFSFSADFAGDCELCGVFPVLAKQVGKQPTACVDEPVTNLGKKEGKSPIICFC